MEWLDRHKFGNSKRRRYFGGVRHLGDTGPSRAPVGLERLGNANSLPADQTIIDVEGRGYRSVEGIDFIKLRLFLLSLSWRAAASRTPEMSRVKLPDVDLERIRLLILTGDPGPMSFYPAQIIQLSTHGPTHNQTPIETIKTIPSFTEGVPEVEIPIFRFYFDGLIVHFHRHESDDGYTASVGNLVVGAKNILSFITLPYNISFQEGILRRMMNESETKFGYIMDKLAWPPKER